MTTEMDKLTALNESVISGGINDRWRGARLLPEGPWSLCKDWVRVYTVDDSLHGRIRDTAIEQATGFFVESLTRQNLGELKLFVGKHASGEER